MIDAAQRELPGVWNRERIRRAINAALDTIPDREPDGEQPTLTANHPVLHPALTRPLELGSLADIARRLGVARSTVTGWTRNRDTNGMPAPVSGDAYDLREIEAWHRAWKDSA